MTIKKFLHSCLLIEENGKRLLIDPGKFSFGEDGVKAEDVGSVDAILITHEHQDHYYPEVLRAFRQLSECQIVTHQAIGNLLSDENISHEIISDNQELHIAGFRVKAFARRHGPLPLPVPDNFAYLINESLLHPGDSYEATDIPCRILALPIVAPWTKLTETIAFAHTVRPKMVIPIHDAFLKDFMRFAPYYAVTKAKLEEKGVAFQPLELGEQLEV